MARAPFNILVIDTAGNVKAGATVEVRRRADNALATVNSAETGAGVASNPLATDAAGRITNAWLERGAYTYTVSGAGIVTYSAPFDAAPAADSALDTGWFGPGQVTAVKVAADVATQAELDAAQAADASALGGVSGRVAAIENNQLPSGLRLRGGSFGVGYSGETTVNVAVAHGLGRTPVSVVACGDSGSEVGVVGWDATNVTIGYRLANAIRWIAVG